ncbi:MAG: ASKHA domain-containing protein, partial [Clostridiales bacterium]|nr:ASKHA domain-containing protein [Clostridiales bacterium]
DGELGEDGRGHGEDDESGREGGGRAEPGAVAGLAIDIGTTSVSALLVDLLTGDPLLSGSSANRQIRYGADVISRIIESARPGGMERLQRAIWHETLEPLIRGVCREAGVGPQSVHRVAFAANTTMTHLLLGVSAESIRLEPYVPAFFSCDGLCGADLPGAAGPGGSGGGARAADMRRLGAPLAEPHRAGATGVADATDAQIADMPSESGGGAGAQAADMRGAGLGGESLHGENSRGISPRDAGSGRVADMPSGSGGGALFRADAEILIAPSIGSYVGGDITAGVFASGMLMSDAISLFIDLGTNGELVVGNEDFLLACACSAGPAFEGGDISCGMRASDGAIESFGADPETLEPSYSVIGGMKPAGVCGSGLIDIVAALFRAGAIDARGRLARDHARIRADAGGMRRFVVAEPSQTETGAEIAVTESDIDNFVRAKAAIFSAIRTLLQIAGLEAGEIENAYIAGGIGSGINIASAVAVGMLPNLPEGRYRYVGNTSLMGAYAMATSRGAAASVARIGGAMTYIELSSHPAYMDEFIAACFLPHTDASLFAAPAAGA